MADLVNKQQYEAVIAIVNNGFSSIVMDAAREVGCRGGTIIHARGTGDPKTEKLYGIVITPDKEFILMIVPKDIVDDVLKAVDKAAGLQTDGHGIVFSLPVDHVVGLKIKK